MNIDYTEIFRKQIFLQKCKIKYRKKGKKYLFLPTGKYGFKLSETYYENLLRQLKKLHTHCLKIQRLCNQNFDVDVSFNDQGILDFENITIQFHTNIIDNRSLPLIERLNPSFKALLPFAEYIYELELRGREYGLTNVDAKLSLSLEDLVMVIEQPIIAPRARTEWWDIIRKTEYSIAKNEYYCDIIIPCLDGELFVQESVVSVMYLYQDEVN